MGVLYSLLKAQYHNIGLYAIAHQVKSDQSLRERKEW